MLGFAVQIWTRKKLLRIKEEGGAWLGEWAARLHSGGACARQPGCTPLCRAHPPKGKMHRCLARSKNVFVTCCTYVNYIHYGTKAKVVGGTGLEPVTSSMSTTRSSQLS